MIEFFSQFPPALAVFLLSMVPGFELNASIPVGIEVYRLPVFFTWALAVAGNTVPALMILAVFPYMHTWVVNHKIFGKQVTKFLKRAENKFSGDFAKYGAIGLIFFLAIPLPLTGVLTGSLAAFVFNIPFKKSAPLITAGLMIAGLVVVLITLFAGGAARALFL